MLPNMTSSKSFRATLLPSSFSLPSFRSASSANSNADRDKSTWKNPRRRGTTNLPRGRQVLVDTSGPKSDPKPNRISSTDSPEIRPPLASTESTVALTKQNCEAVSMSVLPGSQVYDIQAIRDLHNESPVSPTSPTSPTSPASTAWRTRVSSLFPVLTNDDDIDFGTPPIQRKPLALRVTPPETPPPPPYVASESDGTFAGSPRSIPVGPLDDLSPAHISLNSTAPQIHHPPVHPTEQLPEIPEFSFSFPSHDTPQIQAPTPPSPEMKRATLTKQEPVAVLNSSRRSSSNTESDTDSGPGRTHTKLRKENRQPRVRSNSLFHAVISEAPPQQASPITEPRGRRSISAQAPLPSGGARVASMGTNTSNARSTSSRDGSQSPTRGRLRRSWMPGGRSRSNSMDVSNGAKSEAWIMSEDTKAEYNPSFLRNAEKVPELWNEGGNIYVYLYPRSSGCGPSFKVPEFVVGTSYVFNELIHSDQEAGFGRSRAVSFGGRDSLSVSDASRIGSPPVGPPVPESPGSLRLYLPVAPPTAATQLTSPGEVAQAELDRLIAIRNLFAFLTGQPLVGTKTRPNMFHAFIEIAALLQEFGFSSPDGSSFGEAVELSFSFYSEQLGLSDCRHSREKTLEALVLGERMRSVELYNEAFAHAAGKYSAIMDLQLPIYEQISPLTRQRLERAHLDLVNRQHSVNEHLEQFDFPSLFAGIANSTSIPELKLVRFKIWRNSFSKMRHFLLSYYKSTFGSWPPKASSKKNPFAESGLNRLVLKVLYSDMCALYDLLVDRNDLTSRVMDEVPAISSEPSKANMSALRSMLSEFDRSKPPVLPPIPFDLPQIPTMTAIHETFDAMSLKDKTKMEKKLKENELILILNKAYNFDTNSIRLPFLDQFKEFEIREGKGKMAQDLVDQRIGYWLFLYTVLQSLPMLVVDAPGVKNTESVEYFLCEPPMGNLPWLEDRAVRKMWYEVTGGGGIVELSADAVMFSVEATYHRSHCWLAAKQWEGIDGAEAPPPGEPAMSPLQPPRPVFDGAPAFLPSPPVGGPSTPSPPPGGPQPALRPRNLSPARRNRQMSRSSIAMGLEPVPLEPPNPFGSQHRSSSMGPRPLSSHLGARTNSAGNLVGMAARGSSPAPQPKPAATSGATFDDILGQPDKPDKKSASGSKKKGRFF